MFASSTKNSKTNSPVATLSDIKTLQQSIADLRSQLARLEQRFERLDNRSSKKWSNFNQLLSFRHSPFSLRFNGFFNYPPLVEDCELWTRLLSVADDFFRVALHALRNKSQCYLLSGIGFGWWILLQMYEIFPDFLWILLPLLFCFYESLCVHHWDQIIRGNKQRRIKIPNRNDQMGKVG